jgi:pyridoxine/pyridoxamine 5'-phosphate oxidase
MDLGMMRQQFVNAGPSRRDLADDPIQQFASWFEQAMAGATPPVGAICRQSAKKSPGIP